MATTHSENSGTAEGRYEFRVWGKHPVARRLLKETADEITVERFDDCYLIVEDLSWNAKVRDNTLKLKQLVSEKKGFEQWASDRHRSAEDTPSPFDDLFDRLRLDRPQRGKEYDLPEEVARLDGVDGVRAIFVTKNRRRYHFDDVRAEVTDIEIHGSDQTLRTLSIEGENLDQLIDLRTRLGIGDEPNVAMHQLIDHETSD